MKSKVEIIPTKRRLGRTNVGDRGLFVHPDVAKIHVDVVGEARYVTAEDEPKKQTYMTRDMTATTRSPRHALRAARPTPIEPTLAMTVANTEDKTE